MHMASAFVTTLQARFRWVLTICVVCGLALAAATQSSSKSAASKSAAKSTAEVVQTFATPQDAAKALIDAATNFDEPKFKALFGEEGEKIVSTGEQGRDRELAKSFAEQAQE